MSVQSPAGQGDPGIILCHRVKHSILFGDLSRNKPLVCDHSQHTQAPPGGVGDDGVGEVSEPVVALDVVDPAVMVLHRVAAECDHLDASLGKLPGKALGPA